MDGIFDAIGAILVGGAVILTLGLVAYLAYLQYLKMKHRRAHRRHRARRAMRQADVPGVEHRPIHNQQS
jgi:hypothetical protein